MHWSRALRTPHTERSLGVRDGADAIAPDLHYPIEGTAAGTVTFLASAKIANDEIPALLSAFDDGFLPGVSSGEVLANFEATQPFS